MDSQFLAAVNVDAHDTGLSHHTVAILFVSPPSFHKKRSSSCVFAATLFPEKKPSSLITNITITPSPPAS